jgi:Zn-dependent peptidase ImmA (M78 family)/transcriptional regulator with XRE-family HTH domain
VGGIQLSDSAVEALATPPVLSWARQASGLSLEEAAEKSRLDESFLAECEAGTTKLTLHQLRDLARIYKRPLGIFYLPEPPRDYSPVVDFRRASEGHTQKTPELTYEIRHAGERREIAIELLELAGEEIPTFPISATLRTSAERLGDAIRGFLGVSVQQQIAWKSESQAYSQWRSIFEAHGVLVFQTTGVSIQEARGFSIATMPLPAVVVNSQDTHAGRIFTLFHELAHLCLRTGGICDFSDAQQTEVYCNAVAAAALLPKSVFLKDALVAPSKETRAWSDEEIKILSGRYHVSREVILRRLLTFDRVTRPFYERKRATLLAQYRKRKDTGPISQATLAVARSGQFFVNLVLASYQQRRITGSDIADFLNLRLKHLSRLQLELASGRSKAGE